MFPQVNFFTYLCTINYNNKTTNNEKNYHTLSVCYLRFRYGTKQHHRG